MTKNLTLCLSGQQGEGITSLGKILSHAIHNYGYYVFGYRNFSSRIKGGPTSYHLRISSVPIESNVHNINLLLALDQDAIDQNSHLLSKNALIISDQNFEAKVPLKFSHYSFPFTAHAKKLGNNLYRNMVALGVLSSILSLPTKNIKEKISKNLERKKDTVIKANLQAFDIGYSLSKEYPSFSLPFLSEKKDTMILSGNTALSIGLIAGGCRFMAAYPITPASEIMEFLAKKLPPLGGTLIQAEDEISAITMAIGAGYAGVRSVTATSGPGLSLMAEAIGLAGMTEIPLVVVDVQRSGPSTGMPTKQEQSDLEAVLFGGHGEFPKIVLSPGNPQECFEDALNSLNFAEVYQCPVIILSDLKLGLSEYTTKIPSYDCIHITRGKIITQKELNQNTQSHFPRYAITEDGISPRSLPGQKNGLFYTTGVEHDEWGYTDTSPETRVKMHDKRMSKLKDIELNNSFIHCQGNSKTLLVGYGSTKGVLEEAFYKYRDKENPIDTLQLRILSPFPVKSLENILKVYDEIIFIENNSTSQLRNLFHHYLALSQDIRVFSKYDGTFIELDEVIDFLERRAL